MTAGRPKVQTPADDLQNWFARASKGDRHVYHVGHWGADGKVDKKAREVGNMAMEWCDHGWITLVQRRLDEKNFEYVALKL